MDLGPGETRVYSIRDSGATAGARVPATGNFFWNYDTTARGNPTGGIASFNIKPGYTAGYNGGAGLWLTWAEDTAPRIAGNFITGFAMRKVKHRARFDRHRRRPRRLAQLGALHPDPLQLRQRYLDRLGLVALPVPLRSGRSQRPYGLSHS